MTLAIAAAMVAACSRHATRRETAPNAATPERAIVPEDSIALVQNVMEAEAPRLEAARRVVRACRHADMRDRMEELMAGPVNGSQPAMLLARAISEEAEPAAWLVRTLGERLQTAREDERPALYAALGSLGSRESAALLVNALERDDALAARDAALQALVRLSGRSDVEASAVAWRAWLDENATLSEFEWPMQLAAQRLARADRLERERERVANSLADTARLLQVATPASERDALLAGMLASETPELRDIGFELVQRELSTDNALGGQVARECIMLLSDSDATVRTRAAMLARRLAPAEARAAVMTALAVETDVAASAALLLAAQRWLSRDLLPPALRWARGAQPARAAAFDALWALYRSGDLRTAEEEAAALDASRENPAAESTPSQIRLRGALGDETDQAAIASLLNSDSPEARAAAAQHLCWRPERRADVLAAAARHPELFEQAALAQLLHRPDAAGFRELLELARIFDERTNASLLRLAQGTAAAELLEALPAVEDKTLRRLLLEDMISPERVMSVRSDAVASHAVDQAAWYLAVDYLASDEPDRAIAAMDAAAALDSIVGASTITDFRCECLVSFGRLDLAEQTKAGPEAWIRGLERATTKAHGREALTLVRQRFQSQLDDTQMRRVDAAESAILLFEAQRPRASR